MNDIHVINLVPAIGTGSDLILSQSRKLRINKASRCGQLLKRNLSPGPPQCLTQWKPALSCCDWKVERLSPAVSYLSDLSLWLPFHWILQAPAVLFSPCSLYAVEYQLSIHPKGRRSISLMRRNFTEGWRGQTQTPDASRIPASPLRNWWPWASCLMFPCLNLLVCEIAILIMSIL